MLAKFLSAPLFCVYLKSQQLQHEATTKIDQSV